MRRGQSRTLLLFAPLALLTGTVLATACARTAIRGVSGHGILVSRTAGHCQSARVDRDADGLDDECELALAQAFAPELVVDRNDCLFEREADPPRLGGGYLFAVQRGRSGRSVRIAYMPAYYRDCGWEGLACLTRRPDCGAHDGDSELIVVEARQHRPAGWVTDGVFLSAHCFGRSAGRCRWYRGDELRYFSWASGIARGAPQVWVAKGKHANYPSSKECDTGHWYYDSCDDNSFAYRFPIVSNAQNVGSRRAPLPVAGVPRPGCFGPEQLLMRSTTVELAGIECFWSSAASFRGWRRRPVGRSPAPYERLLRVAAEF